MALHTFLVVFIVRWSFQNHQLGKENREEIQKLDEWERRLEREKNELERNRQGIARDEEQANGEQRDRLTAPAIRGEPESSPTGGSSGYTAASI